MIAAIVIGLLVVAVTVAFARTLGAPTSTHNTYRRGK